jgi:hypothetical protein
MSDRDLLEEYERRGTAMKGTGIGPLDDGSIFQSWVNYQDDRKFSWDRSCEEIVRRGGTMVPLLIDMLKREVPRNVKVHNGIYGFGFARTLMEMLSEIGDPRPVPLLLDIAAGFNGRANPMLRTVALDSVEKLTFISFARSVRSNGHNFDAVPVLDNLLDMVWLNRTYSDEYCDASVKRYRGWLGTEGSDPSKWLSLAQSRARRLLAGDDLEAIYQTAEFLQGPLPPLANRTPNRDDNSNATMARIGQILRDAKWTGRDVDGTDIYSWGGKEVHAYSGGIRTDLLAHYGPRARAYVPNLIKMLQQENTPWQRLADGNEIGGKPWMAELISMLPATDAKLAKFGYTPLTSMHDVGSYTVNDPMHPRLDAVTLSQTIRWGIDRWSGRVMADGIEINTWWGANQDKTEQQWLEESLEITASRADHADARNQYLLRLMVPDLPADDYEGSWCPPPNSVQPEIESRPGKPFRLDWIRQHRNNLVYDVERGCFRLRK